MKGLIIYSSLTGNTKKMAENLYNGFSSMGEWVLSDIKTAPLWSDYDVILLGGWIDQGTLDKKILGYLENIEKGKCTLGLFATLGAMPDSFHGAKCYETLNGLLEGHNKLGVYLCPGKVSEAVIKRVEQMPEGILPKEVQLEMIEAGKVSREATEAEYQQAVEFFRSNF